jgi:hypothetical protein
MKYILLYKIEELSKKMILKNYIDKGFDIVSGIDNIILIRRNKDSIKDEDIYIKILYSFIKRSEIAKESKGKIIDLTNAFEYAKKKNGYNKFDNKFEWYIKNTIIKEICH